MSGAVVNVDISLDQPRWLPPVCFTQLGFRCN